MATSRQGHMATGGSKPRRRRGTATPYRTSLGSLNPLDILHQTQDTNTLHVAKQPWLPPSLLPVGVMAHLGAF